MIDSIKRCLNNSSQKIIEIYQLEQQVRQLLGEGYFTAGGYTAFAGAVGELIEQGTLAGVKSSGSNGRAPSLFNRYKKTARDNPGRHHAELMTYHPRMDMRAYRNKAEAYEMDNDYLPQEALAYPFYVQEARRRA